MQEREKKTKTSVLEKQMREEVKRPSTSPDASLMIPSIKTRGDVEAGWKGNALELFAMQRSGLPASRVHKISWVDRRRGSPFVPVNDESFTPH